MRTAIVLFLGLLLAGAAPPPMRSACADDYLTIETVRGTIFEIKPAPEPFKTADIFFSGPRPCERMWLQVLKTDAVRCRVGAPIQVTGIVTMDVENHSWEIGPTRNEFITLGDDFICG